jgi:hypothetical protein
VGLMGIIIGVFVIFFVVIIWVIISNEAKSFYNAYNPVANSHGFDNCDEMAKSIGFRNMTEYENMWKADGTTDRQKIAKGFAYDYDLQVVRGLSGEQLEQQTKYDAHLDLMIIITGLSKYEWEALSEEEKEKKLKNQRILSDTLNICRKITNFKYFIKMDFLNFTQYCGFNQNSTYIDSVCVYC